MIIKDIPRTSCYGVPENLCTLIPKKIVNTDFYGSVVISMEYPDGRMIDYCFDRDEVDFASFGVNG